MRSPHLRPRDSGPIAPIWTVLALLPVLLGARPAAALEIGAGLPHERHGYVWVEVTLGDLFSPRVEGSLARGMPATLTLHAELWRQRGGWFDRLESSFEAGLRLHYDFRVNAYRLERAGAEPLLLASLDSVRAMLTRPLPLPLGRVGPLLAGQRYYAVVSVTLRPLSVEDAEEVEDWLSGQVGRKTGEPFGIITALPRSLFDAARNFAGFGDERARAVTPTFELQDLFPAR